MPPAKGKEGEHMKQLEKLQQLRKAVAANLESERAGDARPNVLRVLGRSLWGIERQIEWIEAGNKISDFKHDPAAARAAVQ